MSTVAPISHLAPLVAASRMPESTRKRRLAAMQADAGVEHINREQIFTKLVRPVPVFTLPVSFFPEPAVPQVPVLTQPTAPDPVWPTNLANSAFTPLRPVSIPALPAGLGPIMPNLDPWTVDKQPDVSKIRRYSITMCTKTCNGAQGGKYQPGRPSVLQIVLRHGEIKTSVSLPVKVALAQPVKESTFSANIAEFALHPNHNICDPDLDLSTAEQVLKTRAPLIPRRTLLRLPSDPQLFIVLHLPGRCGGPRGADSQRQPSARVCGRTPNNGLRDNTRTRQT